MPLEVVADTLAICRLDPSAALPAWTERSSDFLTVSRTPEELSITAVASVVPSDVRCERNYRALRVRGPLPLNLVGILAAIAAPLADAGLSIFATSTFDTDYVLVKARDLDAAVSTLERGRPSGDSSMRDRLDTPAAPPYRGVDSSTSELS
ncbi:MAG TPA: ACT domain-containing protein [Gemmatimonadales bacterium]|nr:ACT domain-containing protein [Gemmatimonadales bacterium]